MKRTGKMILACFFCALALALIAAVRLVDVAPIGPEGTRVGLSTLNGTVHDYTGVNLAWYAITQCLGYGTLLVAAAFAATGIVQMIRRGSPKRIDAEIIALGGLYAATLALYALFEKVVVNYRPVIMPGCEHPEASFPSSHTMLACVVMGSAIMVTGRYFGNVETRRTLRLVCGVVALLVVVGRLISGVHWLTDIVGGLLFSATLLTLFAWAVDALKAAPRQGKGR